MVSFKVARYCVRKQVKASSDGSGSGERQDDERLIRTNPISPEILGDTWRSLESMEGLAPDVTQPNQGVIDVEPMDSSTGFDSALPLDGAEPMPMSIDTLDPGVETSPHDESGIWLCSGI